MTIKTVLLAGTAFLAAGALRAQAPAAAPAFEVASIKPAPPLDPAKIMAGKMHVGLKVDAARVDIGSLSLADLIRIAYKLKSYELSGPDWMTAERFDVMAKIPEGATKEQLPDMLQALLVDRFKLAVHRDTKEHAVYALVVGKNGIKMKELPKESAKEPPKETPPGEGGQVIGSGENQVRVKSSGDGKNVSLSGSKFGQMKFTRGDNGAMRMEFERMTMPALVEMLTSFADRPVLDMTELKGDYQLALELSMEDMMVVARQKAASMGISVPLPPPSAKEAGRAPGDAASAPSSSIFAAVQQLGLKLEPRKAPVEIVVVDHVEKMPTEN